MEGSVYQYYANVRTEPVEWLWYPYIPLGKLTVLQGDPGEGKSTFALNVVARITTGQPMPDGVPAKGKRVAIYQCAEDGIADTIKPRLQQAGADCERVAYIIDNDIALTLEDGRIETAIKDTHASVFIIDPIQAFIPPDADMQSATKMRSVLRKLANIADRNKCAVILIGHMNKGNGAKTLYRGLGSIDIAAIARSVLMISRDESRPDIRYMYLRGLCLERRKEAKTMSVSTDTERIFRIGGYVKRAKLNLRNEREIRAFHRNAIERRFGDFEDGTLVDVYIDITGYKETAKRPEMLRLMRDCADGKVNLIFAETKGYLSANTREFCYWLHFIFNLKERVDIITDDDQFNINTILNADKQREALIKMAEDYIYLNPPDHQKWLNGVVSAITNLREDG